MSSLFVVSLVVALFAAALAAISIVLTIQILEKPVKSLAEVEQEAREVQESQDALMSCSKRCCDGLAHPKEQAHEGNEAHKFRTFRMAEVHTINSGGKAWCCGNTQAPKTVLLLGPCRIITFANFVANHPFFKDCCVYVILVYLIDKHTLQDPQLVSDLIPHNVDYFFHEFLRSFGYLNTDVTQACNIFTLNFLRAGARSVMLPNMPNALLRLRDMVGFERPMREVYERYTQQSGACRCNQDLNCECAQELKTAMVRCRAAHVERWANILDKTQLFETANVLRTQLEKRHLFNTLNHPSNYYSLLVFTEVLRVHFPEIENPRPPSVVAVSKKPEFTDHNNETAPWTVFDRTFLNYEWLAGVHNLARSVTLHQ